MSERTMGLSEAWAMVADASFKHFETLDAVGQDKALDAIAIVRDAIATTPEGIARRIARDCRALHDHTPEEDAKMREALLDMARGIEVRLASMPGAVRLSDGGE